MAAVALVKGASAVFMILDSGSVKLRCATRFGLNGSRRSVAGEACAPRFQLGSTGGLGRARLLLQRLLRLPDFRQRLRTALQLLRQLVPARIRAVALVLFRIDRFCLLQQRAYVRAQDGELRLQPRLRSPSARSSSPCAATRSHAAWCHQRKRPQPTSCACLHSLSVCTNSSPSASKCRLRKRAIER